MTAPANVIDMRGVPTEPICHQLLHCIQSGEQVTSISTPSANTSNENQESSKPQQMSKTILKDVFRKGLT